MRFFRLRKNFGEEENRNKLACLDRKDSKCKYIYRRKYLQRVKNEYNTYLINVKFSL